MMTPRARFVGTGSFGHLMRGLEVRNRRHPIGVHLAALAERDIFADDEAFVPKVRPALAGRGGLVVKGKPPPAPRPLNQVPRRFFPPRPRARDAAGIAIPPPQFRIDAIVGI